MEGGPNSGRCNGGGQDGHDRGGYEDDGHDGSSSEHDRGGDTGQNFNEPEKRGTPRKVNRQSRAKGIAMHRPAWAYIAQARGENANTPSVADDSDALVMLLVRWARCRRPRSESKCCRGRHA